MSLVGGSLDELTITPTRLGELREAGQSIELIDVRTPAEFRSVHATMARLVPLDELDPTTFMKSRRGAASDPLYVICRSGARGDQARKKFQDAGFSNVINVAGGTLAWEQAGLPVVRGKWMLPLDRQVQIVAGTIVLAGFALGELVGSYWFLLSGFVGVGLILAGITGLCPMGKLIAKMPWNHT
jgi:rhodanese-related sulfurtransferase